MKRRETSAARPGVLEVKLPTRVGTLRHPIVFQFMGMRILLADDDPEMLKAVAGMLSALGVVETVADGQALVEAAMRLKPDLIVTDLTMPGLNGIQAVKKINSGNSPPKVIFLTVHNDPDVVSACLAAGASGYVEKKRISPDLMIAIREVTAGRSFLSPSVKIDR